MLVQAAPFFIHRLVSEPSFSRADRMLFGAIKRLRLGQADLRARPILSFGEKNSESIMRDLAPSEAQEKIGGLRSRKRRRNDSRDGIVSMCHQTLGLWFRNLSRDRFKVNRRPELWLRGGGLRERFAVWTNQGFERVWVNVSVRVSLVPSAFVTSIVRVAVPSPLSRVAVTRSVDFPLGPTTVVSFEI